MYLTTNEFYIQLTQELNKVKKSLYIISPYIKLEPARKLIALITGKSLELKLLTLPPGHEYITGSTDLEAILELEMAGFEIRMLKSLHAKVYLIDNRTIFLGSSNFTNNGWGLSENSNKEIMFKQNISKDNLNMIFQEYWNHEQSFSLQSWDNFKEEVKELQEKYSFIQDRLNQAMKDFESIIPAVISPHEALLIMLKEKSIIDNYEHLKKNYYRHAFKINDNQVVKIMRSKEGLTHQQKGYQAFSYQLNEKSASLFVQRDVKALILILEEPDHFVCLPTSLLLEKVLRKTYKGKNNDWQFKIKRNKSEIILTVKGKQSLRRFNIKQYEGNLRFRIIK